MNISIAMATYNGEKYIKEQLQSLSNQTSLPFELVVGDDGSTDATLDILKEFCAHAPFPVRIHQNQANLGFARNFLDTARRCKGDWIAFCDQDDVWLPDKDNLFNFIIYAHGFRVVHIDKSLVEYRQHDTALSNRASVIKSVSLGSSFKCNTQSPLGIGCCDGHTKQAPQQRGTWRDISRA